MPRLTHIVHPYFGRLPVNTHECPSCGVPAGQTCYLMCPRSPAYQSPEQERDDALRTEAEIAAVGFMAWDSAQHKAHGLPCPYDSDPDPDWGDLTDNVSGTPAYKAGFTAGEDGEPNHGDSSITTADERELWGWRDGRAWYRAQHGVDPPLAGGNATPAPTVTYVPDPGPWPDDDDLPF